MLMVAPLCDSRGKIRYFIGAQVDISGLVKDCTDLETLQRLVVQEQGEQNDDNGGNIDGQQESKDDFQDLAEMLNMAELETVRKFGGRMHREYEDEEGDSSRNSAPHMPRLLLQEPTGDINPEFEHSRQSGKLSGIYQNVGILVASQRVGLIRSSTYLSDPTHLFVFFSLRPHYEYLVSFRRLSWTKLAAPHEFATNYLLP